VRALRNDGVLTIALATDGRQVLRLTTGMMALTRLLIGMRAEETGAAPEETLEQLGRRVQQLFSGQK
jgi:hypothetical protein